MEKPTSIRACMHSNPLTISCEAPLAQAVDQLVQFKLTGLTVVDGEGQPCGKLTELNCIRAILNAIYNDGTPDNTRVDQVMDTEYHSCSPDESIVEVAERMCDTHQRRNAVIENGKLVGQVSSSNILWALLAHAREGRK